MWIKEPPALALGEFSLNSAICSPHSLPPTGVLFQRLPVSHGNIRKWELLKQTITGETGTMPQSSAPKSSKLEVLCVNTQKDAKPSRDWWPAKGRGPGKGRGYTESRAAELWGHSSPALPRQPARFQSQRAPALAGQGQLRAGGRKTTLALLHSLSEQMPSEYWCTD